MRPSACVALAWALALGCGTPGVGAAEATRPGANLSPQAVVAGQLAALRRAGHDDAAAYATVYGFASPRNRAMTGPLWHFSHMLKTGYQGLLTHRRVRHYFPAGVAGNEATQRVTVEYADGSEHDFLFFLSRAPRASCDHCWLTDGVQEVPVDGADGLPGGYAL